MFDSSEGVLTIEAARYLLSVKLLLADENRVNELSAKARSGLLTKSETQELDSYLHIGVLLGILQSKARRLLRTEPDYPARQ